MDDDDYMQQAGWDDSQKPFDFSQRAQPADVCTTGVYRIVKSVLNALHGGYSNLRYAREKLIKGQINTNYLKPAWNYIQNGHERVILAVDVKREKNAYPQTYSERLFNFLKRSKINTGIKMTLKTEDP